MLESMNSSIMVAVSCAILCRQYYGPTWGVLAFFAAWGIECLLDRGKKR